MTKWDQKYIELCKKIINEGTRVSNRTGIDTIKIPAHFLSFDLSEEFPTLTTKQLFFRQAILEMLWIYQVQSNDVRWLQERKVNIWNEWEIDEDGIYRTYSPLTYRYLKENEIYKSHIIDGIEYIDNQVPLTDINGQPMYDENKQPILIKAYGNHAKKDNNEIITSAKYFGKNYAHTIGTAYGWINNKFQNTQRLIDTIKNNPNDRRMLMTMWQDDYIKTAVLPSCVWSSEWDVTNNKLNCWVHQRSCDVPLGLPFNVTQYATLVNLIAHVTNLKPGTLNWSIKDAHIYINQLKGIKEQIERYQTLKDLDAPTLWINPEIKDFFEFDNSKDLKDIKVLNYKHHGKINFPIAQ